MRGGQGSSKQNTGMVIFNESIKKKPGESEKVQKLSELVQKFSKNYRLLESFLKELDEYKKQVLDIVKQKNGKLDSNQYLEMWKKLTLCKKRISEEEKNILIVSDAIGVMESKGKSKCSFRTADGKKIEKKHCKEMKGAIEDQLKILRSYAYSLCRFFVCTEHDSKKRQERFDNLIKDKVFVKLLEFSSVEKYTHLDMKFFCDIARLLESNGEDKKAKDLRENILNYRWEGALAWLSYIDDGSDENATCKAYREVKSIGKKDMEDVNAFSEEINSYMDKFIDRIMNTLNVSEVTYNYVDNELGVNENNSIPSEFYALKRKLSKAIDFLESLFFDKPTLKEDMLNDQYLIAYYYVGYIKALLKENSAIDCFKKVVEGNKKLEEFSSIWIDAKKMMFTLYRFGIGVKKNINGALGCLNDEQIANHDFVNFVLGKMYLEGDQDPYGEKVKIDVEKAIIHLKAALQCVKKEGKNHCHIAILLSKAYFKSHLESDGKCHSIDELLSNIKRDMGSDFVDSMELRAKFAVMMAQENPKNIDLVEKCFAGIEGDYNDFLLKNYFLGTVYDNKFEYSMESQGYAKRCFKKIIERSYENACNKNLQSLLKTPPSQLYFMHMYVSSCEMLFEIYKKQVNTGSLNNELNYLENAIKVICRFVETTWGYKHNLEYSVRNFTDKLLNLTDEISLLRDMGSFEIKYQAEQVIEKIAESSGRPEIQNNNYTHVQTVSYSLRATHEEYIELFSQSDDSLQGKTQRIDRALTLLEDDGAIDIRTFAYLAENLDSLFLQAGPHRINFLSDKLTYFFSKVSIFIDNANQEGLATKYLLILISSVSSMRISPDDILVNSIFWKAYQLLAARVNKLSLRQIARIVYFTAEIGVTDYCYEHLTVIIKELLARIKSNKIDTKLMEIKENIRLLYKITELMNSIQKDKNIDLYQAMLNITDNLRDSIIDARSLLLEQDAKEVFLPLVSYNMLAHYFGKDDIFSALNFLTEANEKTEEILKKSANPSLVQKQVFDLLGVCLKNELNQGYSLQQEVSLSGLPPEDICLCDKQNQLVAIVKVDGVQHNLFSGDGSISSLKPNILTPKDKLRDTILRKLFPDALIIHVPVTQYTEAEDKLQWLQDNVVPLIKQKISSSKAIIMSSTLIDNTPNKDVSISVINQNLPSPSCCC